MERPSVLIGLSVDRPTTHLTGPPVCADRLMMGGAVVAGPVGGRGGALADRGDFFRQSCTALRSPVDQRSCRSWWYWNRASRWSASPVRVKPRSHLSATGQP